MSKLEFLAQLRKGLSGLPQGDIEERIKFYAEMIDDRMEEGFSEKEAVLSVGSVDEIKDAIVPVKEKKRRLKMSEILLLVLGSPIWLPLGVSAIAVIFSLYVSTWAVVISLWAVFVSLVVSCPGSIASGIIFVCNANVLSGIAMFGCGAVCAGLSVFMFFGCKAATKGTLLLTKKTAVWIKNCFTKREVVQ